MRKKGLILSLFAASVLALASCGDETPTEPTAQVTPEKENTTTPEKTQDENNQDKTDNNQENNQQTTDNNQENNQQTTDNNQENNQQTTDNNQENNQQTTDNNQQDNNETVETKIVYDKDIDVKTLTPVKYSIRDYATLKKSIESLSSKLSGIEATVKQQNSVCYNEEIYTVSNERNTNNSYYSNNVILEKTTYNNDENELPFPTYGPYGPYAVPAFSAKASINAVVAAPKVSISVPSGIRVGVPSFMPVPMNNGIKEKNKAYYATDEYTVIKTESIYEDDYSSDELSVTDDTFDEIVNDIIANNVSLPSFYELYSIDETHFVITIQMNDAYTDQINNGSSTQNVRNIHTTNAIAYLTKADGEYTIDYLYSKMTDSTNYMYDISNGKLVACDLANPYFILESELTFKYGRTEYEDTENLVKDLNNNADVEPGRFNKYSIVFDDNDDTKIVNAENMSEIYYPNFDLISDEGNKFNVDLACELTYDRLYEFKISIENTTVNPKLFNNQKLEENEEPISNNEISAKLDFGNLELPENFTTVTIGDNSYIRVTVPMDKQYMVIFNVDATLNTESNTVTATVNSIDVFEFNFDNYKVLK